MSRAKWRHIAIGSGFLNLFFVFYVISIALPFSTKIENKTSLLSIFVEKESILPVHVYVEKKKIGVVRTTLSSLGDCESAHVKIELDNESKYELTMYGKNWKYKKNVYVTADKCEKIIIK